MDTGRVDICWATDGDTFTMSWTERDGPQVSPPQRRGFGNIVMQEMAERSLDGRVELDYPPAGVTWRLTCLTGNVLEPEKISAGRLSGNGGLDCRPPQRGRNERARR
jgi:hypothetical protein